MRALCIKPIDRISRPALVRQSSPAGAPQNEHWMRNSCSVRYMRIARSFSACAGVPITSPPANNEVEQDLTLGKRHKDEARHPASRSGAADRGEYRQTARSAQQAG